MILEDYSKYYIQGSDHYLIPKDEFIELFNEMSNWREEAKELKKQLEEYKDKINWYENFEVNKTIDKLRLKHNTQQKEFIKYLEDYLNLFDNMCIDEQGDYDMLEEILKEYKSIIGDDALSEPTITQ